FYSLACTDEDGVDCYSSLDPSSSPLTAYPLAPGHIVRAMADGTASYEVNGFPGFYELQVVDLGPDDFGEPSAPVLLATLGSSIQGAFQVAGDQDAFAVSLTAG